MSAEFNEVDRIFEDFTEPGSPGCAVGVFRNGELGYSAGYGLASIEHSIPFTPATIVNLASMSKQFTGMAVALLEADGVLSLADDIRLHLPEMHNFGHPISVRHLVHHTSGLRGTYPELFLLGGWRMADLMTTEHAFQLLAAQRELNYEPGAEFLYVNSGYTLLAMIVERVSGQPFRGFMQERVFAPLGMSVTSIHDDHGALIPGASGSYYRMDDGGWGTAAVNDSVIGPTNVWSTIEDLAAWDRNFTTGEVGGRAVVERLSEPGALSDGTQIGYAFGLEAGPDRTHRGWRVVEHGGQHGGHCGHYLRFPDAGLGIAVLFNQFLWNARDYATRVADVLLDDRSRPDPDAQPVVVQEQAKVGELDAFAGRYFDHARAALRTVAVADGKLTYEGHVLGAVASNRFVIEVAPTVEIEFISVAGRRRVVTHTPDGDYEYELVDPPVVEAGALADFAGTYFSPELGVTWTVQASEEHLDVRRPRCPDTVMAPVFRDGFVDDWAPIAGFPFSFNARFERGAAGEVEGLRVSGDRVRNLRFDRQ